jgi:tripartite-type tricarboxylate transporter receptor subunit TctC
MIAIKRGFATGMFMLLELVWLVIAPVATAQPYPSGIIRIVVPAAAGSPPDIIGRLFARELGENEGWRVMVESKPGAMGSIALADVIKQPADGHTLALIGLPDAVAPALLPQASLRPDTDFVPVINLASTYQVLVVHPAVSAKSLAELIALLKKQPDRFTFSSGGFGTPAHIAGEMFKLHAGVRVTHVPYQTMPRAISDLVGRLLFRRLHRVFHGLDGREFHVVELSVHLLDAPDIFVVDDVARLRIDRHWTARAFPLEALHGGN